MSNDSSTPAIDLASSLGLTIFWRRLLNAARLSPTIMARALTPAVPPKMYRHFAVFTIALTAGLAMFADGENREAIAARIDQQQHDAELRRASAARFGAPRIGHASPKPDRGFDDESLRSDHPFGQPMTTFGPQLTYRRTHVIPTDLAAQAVEAGYSEEYLASLSEEERDRLLEGLRENHLLSPAERNRITARLDAASRRRSGGAPTSD